MAAEADTGEVVTAAEADTARAVEEVDTALAVDMSAADTLRPGTSWLGMDPAHASRSGMDPVYASRPGIAPVPSSRVDTAAISGTAVGGTTALARAGYGRTFTASTCGGAIEVLQSRRCNGCAIASHDELIHHLPGIGQVLEWPRRGIGCRGAELDRGLELRVCQRSGDLIDPNPPDELAQ